MGDRSKAGRPSNASRSAPPGQRSVKDFWPAPRSSQCVSSFIGVRDGADQDSDSPRQKRAKVCTPDVLVSVDECDILNLVDDSELVAEAEPAVAQPVQETGTGIMIPESKGRKRYTIPCDHQVFKHFAYR